MSGSKIPFPSVLSEGFLDAENIYWVKILTLGCGKFIIYRAFVVLCIDLLRVFKVVFPYSFQFGYLGELEIS